MPGKRRNKSPHVLETIPAIAEYLGKHPNTIGRWIKYHDLPAMRMPSGHWMTTRDAITAWIIAGGRAERKRRGWDQYKGRMDKV